MDDALRSFFKFDEADLAANRAGKYSERQRAAFKQDAGYYKKLALVVGVVSIGLAIGTAAVGVVMAASDVVALIGLGIVVLLLAVLAAVCFRSVLRPTGDISDARIKRIEGPAKVNYGEHSDVYLRVKGQSWEIDDTVASSIKEGDLYAMYIGGRLDADFLSIEHIGPATA